LKRGSPYAVRPLSVLSVCNVGVVVWPNGWMDQDETWHVGPRPWPQCAMMKTQLSFGQRGTTPSQFSAHQFSVHVYCGQMAGWMKTPLGTEVDLGPSHTVLHGDPAALPRKWHNSPVFSAHVYCGHGRPSQLLLSSCHCSRQLETRAQQLLKWATVWSQ